MLANTTLSFSSMVGPAEKVEFYGHPIEYIAPSVYGHPHVSNHLFFFNEKISSFVKVARQLSHVIDILSPALLET